MAKNVRIHPRNTHQGYHAETFILSGSGYPKFEVQRGWYEVDDETAEVLSKKLNNPQDPSSKPIFQICSKEEAKALDESEKEIRAAADAPIPMPRSVQKSIQSVTDDLTSQEAVSSETATAVKAKPKSAKKLQKTAKTASKV